MPSKSVPVGPHPRELDRALRERGQASWAELVARHGVTFRLGKSLVATCDPELAAALLYDRAHTEKRSKLHEGMRAAVPGLHGILFEDGEAWRARIAALMPALKPTKVAGVGERIEAEARAMIAQGQGSDLAGRVHELGRRVFLSQALGAAAGERLGDALDAWLARLERPSERLDVPHITPGRMLRLPLYRRALRARHAEVKAAVAEALPGAPPESWAWRLREKAGLTRDEIAEELTHVFWAYDAVHYVMTAALAELGSRPAWQERLREEGAGALEGRAFPTRDDRDEVPLLWGFVRETQRRYPATLGVARRVGERMDLTGGGHLDPGDEVLILLHPIHHDPERWDEPLEFVPERWLGRPGERRDLVTFAPYLHGPRQCIGRHLADLMLSITLATVVRDAELVTGAPPGLTSHMIPRFDTPIPFEFRPRA